MTMTTAMSHIAACRYLSGNIGAQGCALAFFF